MSDDVEVKLGADTSDAVSGFKDAGAAIGNTLQDINKKLETFGTQSKQSNDKVNDANKEMLGSFKKLQEGVKGSFESIGHVFEAFESKIFALGAIVAGGALFKSAVGEVGKSVAEMKALQNAFGGTSEEATQLSTALKLIGKSSEDYIGVAQKFQRQVKNNSATLDELGVKTRDASGNLLPLREQMQSGLQVMMQYEAGADRNAVAMELFGRNAQEAYGFLKLNDAIMARATQLMKDLNIENGPEKQAAVKKYREEQAALKLVFEEIEEQIGEALLPVLTKFATWLNEIGPGALKVFSVAIKVVETVVAEMVAGLLTAYESIKNFGSATIDLAKSLGQSAVAAVKGNFSDIPKIFAANNAAAVANSKVSADRIADIWKDANERVGKLWGEEKHGSAGDDVAPGGHKKAPNFSKGGGKDQSAIGGWDAELSAAKNAYAQMKLDAGSFERYSKEQEAAFWQSKIALTAEGSKDRQEVLKRYYDLEYQIKEEAFKAEIALLEASKQEYKNNIDARIAITEQEYDKIAKAYGKESAQAQQAYGKILEERRRLAEQKKRVTDTEAKETEATALHDVEMDRLAMGQKVAMDQATKAQSLAADQQFENRIYDIKKKGLDDRLALAEGDRDQNPELIAQLNAQKEGLEQDHQTKITQIKNDAIKEQEKYQLQAQQAFKDSFGSLIDSLESGNKKFKDILKDWANSLVASINKIAAAQLQERFFGGGSGGSSSDGGGFGSLFSSIGSLFGGMASFDVGTPYVPQDQVAMIHKGEAIVPAAQNKPGAMGGVTVNFAMHTGGAAVDHRTQQQIAAAIAGKLQGAQKRNS